MTKESIYITGHRHPDTDSIASAIAYSFFKKSMGIQAIPCRLGTLNEETRYLLNRFGFQEPLLLQDARLRVSEINMDEPVSISPKTTIHEALQMMQNNNLAYCGVIDENQHLLGMVTKSDIAVVALGDTAMSVDILAKTSIEMITKTIKGKVIYSDELMHTNGKVCIIAMTELERLHCYDVKNRIIIIGDNTEAQLRIIRSGAGVLIAVRTEKIDKCVLEEAKKYHCPIVLSGLNSMNTSRYLYFAPPVELIMKTGIVSFRTNELAEDVGIKMLKSRFRVYPVIDLENRLIGYISRYHIMDAPKRKMILVDHNEFSQSVNAIEKGMVLEVIDHHRINDFSTAQPVAFRNEIVGSTATIVATIFRENQIPIPERLAGLLLGAILSDTMNFHSPTTTRRDQSTADILAAIADIDIDVFAQDMFDVTTNQEKISLSEMINQDLKIYDIHTCKISISQVMVSSAKEIQFDVRDILKALDSFAEKKRLDLVVLVMTSVFESGSVIYAGGERAIWAYETFPDKEGEEHSLQKQLMSRKQQILPAISKTIANYMGG